MKKQKAQLFGTLAAMLLVAGATRGQEEPEIILTSGLSARVGSATQFDPGCNTSDQWTYSATEPSSEMGGTNTGCQSYARAKASFDGHTIALSNIDIQVPTGGTSLTGYSYMDTIPIESETGIVGFVDNEDGTATMNYTATGTLPAGNVNPRIRWYYRITGNGNTAFALLDVIGSNLSVPVDTAFTYQAKATATYFDDPVKGRLYTSVKGHFCLTVQGECCLEADQDGDGVPDDDDEFPSSITDPLVPYGNIEIDNHHIENGAWLADEIDWAMEHDATRDVVSILIEMKHSGLITGREMGQILREHNTTQ